MGIDGGKPPFDSCGRREAKTVPSFCGRFNSSNPVPFIATCYFGFLGRIRSAGGVSGLYVTAIAH